MPDVLISGNARDCLYADICDVPLSCTDRTMLPNRVRVSSLISVWKAAMAVPLHVLLVQCHETRWCDLAYCYWQQGNNPPKRCHALHCRESGNSGSGNRPEIMVASLFKHENGPMFSVIYLIYGIMIFYCKTWSGTGRLEKCDCTL